MIFDKEREIAGMVSSASVPRETQAIDRPVSTGRDAHAGPDRVWVDSWKSQKRLPDAVRITVRDTVLNGCDSKRCRVGSVWIDLAGGLG